MIALSKFTALNDLREYLNTPFNHGNYTIASDGRTVLLSPRDPQYDHNQCSPSNAALANRVITAIEKTPVAPLQKAIALPEKSSCLTCNGTGRQPTTKTCEECAGNGYVWFENDFNDYTCICESCKGDGEIVTKHSSDDPICDECDGSGESWPHRLDVNGTVVINGMHYNPVFINRIIDQPDLMIGTASYDTNIPGALIFACGNQRGAILQIQV